MPAHFADTAKCDAGPAVRDMPLACDCSTSIIGASSMKGLFASCLPGLAFAGGAGDAHTAVYVVRVGDDVKINLTLARRR